jgi:hypothetical protein
LFAAATPRATKNRFTEATPAGYNYPYNESPDSAFLEPLIQFFPPLAADAVWVVLCAALQGNLSQTIVISPLFTILKPSEGKNHEDRNPNYGLA